MGKEDNGKTAQRKDRYWSVMLVGDRGRIIPFRHFKGIALTVCCVSVLLLVAFVIMSLLYLRQGQALADLESELKDAKVQIAKLRDEKDLYLTKLMLTQKQENPEPRQEKASGSLEPQASEPKESKPGSDAKAETKVEKKSTVPAKKAETPPKPALAPKVVWKADIRRFSVTYDAKLEVLKAQFRIYNTSKPKKRLSGRSVVVFKVQDDPPVKWLPVPRVQLRDGEPTGTRGQVFRVKNYLTMKFRAYRQKIPVAYNTATVFVFSEEGRILASKDFAFKIATLPPKKKPQPLPAAVEKKNPVPVQQPTVQQQQTTPSAPGGGQEGGTVMPTDEVTAGSGSTIDTPEGSQAQPTVELTPSDSADSLPSSETPSVPSEEKPQTESESPTATEPSVNAPQPKVEGVP